MSRKAMIVSALLLGVFLTGAAMAQDAKKPANYPVKPVTIQVGWPAGGGSDLMSRALADAMRAPLGKAVVVVNREGAGGTISHAEMAAAAPDGYTLAITTSGTYSAQPLLRPVEYDIEDFDFLIGISNEVLGLYVPASLGVDSVESFKKKFANQEVIVGTHGAGSIPAFGVEEVFPKLGVEYTVINYGGSGEVLPALLGEHINVGFMHPHEAISNMRAGTIKCIGLAAPERLADYSDNPTFREQGIDWVSGVYKGIIMPKGGDPEVVAFLESVLKEAVNSPKFMDYAKKNNVPLEITTGAELKENILKQSESFKKIVEAQKK